MSTKIEWTDETWNPITGCTVKSAGCRDCYAMTLAGTRLKNHPSRAGLTRQNAAGKHIWTGEVRFNQAWLDQPLKWKKPRMIFVCAHGDLFHEDVPDEWIDQIFAVMALCPDHIFQVLTKRPDRMRDYCTKFLEDDGCNARITKAVNLAFAISGKNWGRCGSTSTAITTRINGTGAREPLMLRGTGDGGVERLYLGKDLSETWHRCSDQYAERVPDYVKDSGEFGWGLKLWPLPNVWLGVSVEDQESANERIPDLLETPAAVRWLSCEPLLGSIDFDDIWWQRDVRDASGDVVDYDSAIDWVVLGGESGSTARPMHPDWARQIRDQCEAANVPFFFKQWGGYAPPIDKVDKAPVPNMNHHAWVCKDGSVICPPDAAGYEKMYDAEDQYGPDYYRLTVKVGKKKAGRKLDGRTHDAMPMVQS